MQDMVRIVHNNYEKITDDLIWLNKDWILKFVVTLNKYNDKYGRVNYHKEVLYTKDGNDCININRSFDYNLSLESTVKDSNNNKQIIPIKNGDMYTLKIKLNNICKWFTSSEYESMFVRKDGKIIQTIRPEPIRIYLTYGNFIEFEPSIFSFNEDQYIGARVYINSESDGFFIGVNKLLEVTDFINNFNMYQSAQLMINYLSRPENGTNLYDINNNNALNNYNNKSGFFDRISNKNNK